MERAAEKLNKNISVRIAVEPAQSSPARAAVALAAAANVLWGTSFLASKYTLQVWGPVTATVIRFSIALALMLIIFPILGFQIRRLKNLSEWFRVALIGLTGFGMLYPLQLQGLVFIPSNLSACLMLTSPLFVILFARMLLGEQISKWKFVGIFLGILGGIILLNPVSAFRGLPGIIQHFYLGCGLTLAASAALAISVVITRKSALELNTASLTFWTIFIGTFMLIPLAFFETQPANSFANFPSAIVATLFLSVCCTVLCFYLWNKAISLLEVKQLASTMHLKTPVAILVGTVVAHEPLTLAIVVGCLTVAGGVLISQKK